MDLVFEVQHLVICRQHLAVFAAKGFDLFLRQRRTDAAAGQNTLQPLFFLENERFVIGHDRLCFEAVLRPFGKHIGVLAEAAAAPLGIIAQNKALHLGDLFILERQPVHKYLGKQAAGL